MKLNAFAACAALLISGSVAIAQNSEEFDPAAETSTEFAAPTSIYKPTGTVLYDNGPLVNSPGTGSGGLDESLVQNNTLGMTTLGIRNLQGTDRLADDFTVPAGGWLVNQIDFFGYQTGSPTTSTFTGLTLQIWDGPPQQPGSSVIFGDPTTNVLTNSAFFQVWRAAESTSGDTARPIMANTVGGLSLNLAAGTYWLDWSASGTLGSGPWAPPITINGQTSTGNALVSSDVGVTYAPWEDGGTLTPQGAPFIISGTLPNADVSVVKTAAAPTPLVVGSNITYTLAANNAGPGQADNVVVTDPLPANVTYVSNTCGAAFAAPTLTWTIGTLASGAGATCDVAVQVNNFGPIDNTATIATTSTDPMPGNNTSTSSLGGVPFPADVSVTLASDAPVGAIGVGTQFNYTVVGSNAGPGAAADLLFTLTLSNKVSFVSSSCGAVAAGNSVTWTVASLASGASTSCAITVAVVAPGDLLATVNVTTSTDDPNLVNNVAELVVGFVATQVPTLGNFALLLLVLLMAGATVVVIRR